MSTGTSLRAFTLCALLAGCGSAGSAERLSPNGGGGTGGDPGGTGLGPGGAQDFGRFKAILDAGKVPSPDTLDQVGFFAEHTIGKPPTTCNDAVCIRGSFGQMGNLITGTTCSIIEIGLGTPLDPQQLPRPALDLAVVIDTAAPSLVSQANLPTLRAAVGAMLDGLEAVDQVTLIAAGDTAVVLADRVDAAAARAALARLASSANTNLYEGMRAAVDALGPAVQGRHRRLILASEGKPSAGIRVPDRLLKLAQAFAEGGGGVTAIEMGLSADARLLQQLADAGAGTLYFAQSVGELPALFQREVQYSLVPVAEKVRLRMTPGSAYDIREVTGIKQWSLDAAGGSIDIPALFVAWRKTMNIVDGRRGGGGGIMVELMARRNANPAERQVATLQLDYALPGGAGTGSTMVKVLSPNEPNASVPAGYFDDPSVEKGFVVLNFYVAFRMGSERATAGDMRGAWDVLNAVQVNGTRWEARHPDAEIRDDLKYVQKFLDILASRGALDQPARAGQFNEPWPRD